MTPNALAPEADRPRGESNVAPQVTACRHPGSLDSAQPRPQLRIGWFGTSLMQHLEAHNPRLHFQTDLPEIGETIEVTEHRHRGYVTALITHWQTVYPWVTITSDNHGEGGATSRDVLTNLRAAIDDGSWWDLAVLGVGINDVCSLAKFICCSSDYRRGRRPRVARSSSTSGQATVPNMAWVCGAVR